ncbi:lipid-A-disaccharide synthase [Thermosynechococcaceae cyanobacterium BACA0444]|uniref:Lipid-A-disaccharide synthase n=1 Tax=Pseudocalidococcus azoricus BACA0444 TaxID=2918990 RepID=A0AAE4FRC1_9CYAN|nr:lipid-A-disaccharide synthase [Pseudocalidococcus azoricus]MDS3860883.1 lipid-A-disaccharide synthase [Pseudocalidococcus azoricus BACA0444]
MSAPLDILILSNGPGELATWVYPVVQALRQKLGTNPENLRISLVLSPCPHASGQEAIAGAKIPGIDRVQGAAHFWQFLIWGKTEDHWDWRPRGLVLFLGGDQFFALWLAKRLGYKSLIYAEWEARWLAQIDHFALRREMPIPAAYQHKAKVVGDLMTESQALLTPATQAQIEESLNLSPTTPLIGLLPGSKPIKLHLGVPFMVTIAAHLQKLQPQARFVIPVAPTLNLKTLANYANPTTNPDFCLIDGVTAHLQEPEQGLPYLETTTGAKIYLWQKLPNYDLLSRCQLCLTTVGANTAELGALAVPMMVLLPQEQLQLKQGIVADGLGGLMIGLPGLQRWGSVLMFWFMVLQGLTWTQAWQVLTQKPLDWALIKQGLGLRAWPNIWANQEIVPELVGPLDPLGLAEQIADLLSQPQTLMEMRQQLQRIRGEAGAAAKIANLAAQLLDSAPILSAPLPPLSSS